MPAWPEATTSGRPSIGVWINLAGFAMHVFQRPMHTTLWVPAQM